MRIERRGDFHAAEPSPGVRLWALPSRQFKTTHVRVFLHRPLDEHVARAALVSTLLRRGTTRFPTMRALAAYLEGLYAAHFSTDVMKLGERQILVLSLDVLNDRYLPRPLGLLEKGLDFVREALQEPATPGGEWPDDVVAQERTNLRRFVEGLLNDKISYATERCTEEMFRGEPYGRYEYGTVEAIDTERAKGLLAFHRGVVERAPVDVFLLGDLDPRRALATLAERLAFPSAAVRPDLPAPVALPPRPARRVEERRPIEQGKVVMGFRIPRPADDRGFYGLILFNSLLGGGPFSKLFRNVREKEGLCYYAHSNVDKQKGALFVSTGVDTAKGERAIDLCRKQIGELRRGAVTRDELRAARATLGNRLRSLVDGPSQRVTFTLDLALSGRLRPLGEVLGLVARATPRDAAASVEGMWEDTVYFLREEERAAAGKGGAAAAAKGEKARRAAAGPANGARA